MPSPSSDGSDASDRSPAPIDQSKLAAPVPPAPQIHSSVPGSMGPPPPKPPPSLVSSRSHKPPSPRSRSPSLSPPPSPSPSPSSSPSSSPSRVPMGPPPPRASPPLGWSSRSGSPPPPPPFSLITDRHHLPMSSLRLPSSSFSLDERTVISAVHSAQPPSNKGGTTSGGQREEAAALMGPPPPRPGRSIPLGQPTTTETPGPDEGETSVSSSGGQTLQVEMPLESRSKPGHREGGEGVPLAEEEGDKDVSKAMAASESKEGEGEEQLLSRSAQAEPIGELLSGKDAGSFSEVCERSSLSGRALQEVSEKLLHVDNEKLLSSAPPYVKPLWSAAPDVPYILEVLKDGVIVGELDVSKKGAYMFGRSDRADFLLEHPSISRFHAVIQYRKGGEAFIFDLGSTHGTHVNKRQVKPRVYVPLEIGNIIRFGKSSRLYVLQGPTELMPEEGLSRAERHAVRLLEAVQERKLRDESLAVAMAAAATAPEATWGLQEDAEEEEEKDVEEMSWRTYKGELTEKQQKLSEKIQKREEKLSHLKREIEAIQAKELSQGGLTQGQQTQIARNEQRIELIVDEVETLDETLDESIRESIYGRSKKAKDGGGGRKRREGSDDESEDSDSDEFYDRAGASRKKVMAGRKTAPVQKVETAETLLEKKDAFEREKEKILRSLQDEETKKTEEDSSESRKSKGSENGIDMGGQIGIQNSVSTDPLDEYMSNVSSQIESDRASWLKRELEEVEESLGRVIRLLNIADPAGEAQRNWKPKPVHSKANRSASARRQQSILKVGTGFVAVSGIKDRRPEEPTMVERIMVSTGAEQPLPVADSSSVEAKERSPVRGTSDDTVEQDNKMVVSGEARGESDCTESMGPPPSMPARQVKGPVWLGAARAQPERGPTETRKHGGDADMAGLAKEQSAVGSFLARTELKQQRRREQTDQSEKEREAVERGVEAELAVAGDVALLLKHSSRERDAGSVTEDDKGAKKRKREPVVGREEGKRNGVLVTLEETDVDWIPPEGQSGDGRTSLNDKFGY